ncbi:MAG: tetratricopeptide repeat protein [Planctomycetes bacterium]|nr:tetratricopeptide repeat protein [Planctomycetota bacterium]MCB9904316.1 tetratricopeptide repeat protein [Planctomycetota bacterium]
MSDGTTATETEVRDSASFNIHSDPIPSFGSLQAARADIFQRERKLHGFSDVVSGMSDSGEEGRRKGLGLWMVGRYDEAAKILADYQGDDVAAFTCANALTSLRRFKDAAPVFKQLSDKYGDEPRPRAGWLEALLEEDLAAGKEGEEAIGRCAKGWAEAPESFQKSAEGKYLSGRMAECRRDWDAALESYAAARDIDPSHRTNLFHLAHLAERHGHDELALECYEVLLSMLPLDKRVLMNLGVLYEDLGRDQEAAACYDTVVRADARDPRARLFLEDARAGMDMYYDEDMERKEDRLNQILRIPITDFELSVRARNCLNKMNILSLGDLVRKTEQELLSYKNFGETSLNEIKEILGSKGLRLGMAREEAVASIESTRQRYTTGENVEAMNLPLSDLELSIRARRTVESLGCLTLGDIVQHSEDELLGMPNFGVTSLQELKEKLTERGLALKSKES